MTDKQILDNACDTFRATLAHSSKDSATKRAMRAIDAWNKAEKELLKNRGKYYRT